MKSYIVWFWLASDPEMNRTIKIEAENFTVLFNKILERRLFGELYRFD